MRKSSARPSQFLNCRGAKKARITILKTTLDKELAAEYLTRG